VIIGLREGEKSAARDKVAKKEIGIVLIGANWSFL